MRALLGLLVLLVAACGTESDTAAPQPPDRGPLDDEDKPPRVLLPTPVHADRDGPGIRPETPLPLWQPGYHQALRWEVEVPGRTTYRVRVPIGRAGTHLRFAFRSGDGAAKLHGATVAAAGTGGELASDPIELTFEGSSGFSIGPRERVLSDPISYEVAVHDELYVSFQVEGRMAAGAIDILPDSWASSDTGPGARKLDDRQEQRAVGLQSILVRGPKSRAFVALGDSITEGFVDGRDDYRRAWPQVAEAIAGVPVANAGVSGQGTWAARQFLEGEVLVLEGITDCVVLLGTNDLGAMDEVGIAQRLAGIYDQLRPFCTVWGATLPPRDRPDVTDEVRRRRRALNDWLQNEADLAGVIDFASVVEDPSSSDHWKEDLDEDGVHPSNRGQQVMGEEAGRFLGGVLSD